MSTEKIDEKQDGTATKNKLPSFESLNIPPHLLSALYDLKYESPSEIQINALPKLMETPPRNFIGQSQTGSGNTVTFLIAALNCIQQELMQTQVIVVAPTCELVKQIVDVAVNLSKYMKIKVRKLILPPDDQEETFDDHLIVGLPNVLKICIQNENINLQMLRMIILDEADELLVASNPGYAQIIPLLKTIPKTAQRVLFSSTINAIKQETLNSYFPNAEKVELSVDKLLPDNVVQYFVLLATVDERMQFLRDLYKQFAIGQLIVFVQTTEQGNELYRFLTDDNHQVSVVRGGDMTGAERDTALESFRKGITRVLVSTNVVARGIDIPQVNIVINFDVPRQPDQLPDHDTYLHRIGRAGRYGRVGVALTFVDENETEPIEYFSWEKKNMMTMRKKYKRNKKEKHQKKNKEEKHQKKNKEDKKKNKEEEDKKKNKKEDKKKNKEEEDKKKNKKEKQLKKNKEERQLKNNIEEKHQKKNKEQDKKKNKEEEDKKKNKKEDKKKNKEEDKKKNKKEEDKKKNKEEDKKNKKEEDKKKNKKKSIRRRIKKKLQILSLLQYGKVIEQRKKINEDGSIGSIFGNCSICLEQIVVGDEITIIADCLHPYHKTCILPWFEQKILGKRREEVIFFCPNCRYQIKSLALGTIAPT
ncbi:MAG: putative ATP-dependent RNA helicase DBP5 [Streblomastix strix]|uniref:Putative ATP-dependent RNA helicase DBP5 n=1 Tax=Streblomastix strix TaxID=222440 RepID=A0A5J4WAT3_9EUKA|nr:MAG: putative ATP-dependent RNA helicase DBP5 [Streblomastix strix]